MSKVSYKLKDWAPGTALECIPLDVVAYSDMVFAWIKGALPEGTVLCSVDLKVTVDVLRTPAEFREYKFEVPVASESAKPVPGEEARGGFRVTVTGFPKEEKPKEGAKDS